ncbi:hypothetical protein RJT34_25635 [Clitoria ternatea]|uniref:TF-B3 domain-containing protein n=1 Tax=Clitoria ternatea TaxID=43366 RepID=A0AAN9ILG9_CLITE
MATQIRLQPNAVLPFHFFKIITGPNLQRLRIPNKFTKLYGGGLPNPVLLKPKDCAEWKVYWTKEMKFIGTSKIDVIILDQSATEIDYPSYEDIHIVELKDDGLDQRVRPKSPLVSGSAGSSLRGNAILPISFFKIILKTNLARLKIPNKFTRIYGDGLANPVFIKPPDGTEWEVYWTKHNDEVWLEKGWKEFVERYSLDQGHLVVFKYKGTCHMDVLIHDQTALEINYPNIPPPYAKDNLDQNQSHHEIKSMDISGELPDQNTTQIRGEKSALNLSLNYPKEPRALEVARKFISQNPFFTVYIKHSLLKGSLVSLPDLKFDIGDKKEVTVKSGERSWNVKLLRCYPSASPFQTNKTASPLQTGTMAGFSSGRNAILPISFFKIILKTNLLSLKIPNKFTSIYGGGLSNPVFIKPPDGTEWGVYWTKHNDEVWLEKGWKEFVENYSLDQGHVVVFKYKGTSHMDVLILDQTSLEINYPNIPPPYAKDNLDPNQSHHEIKSMDISDEYPYQNTTQIRGFNLNYPKEKRAQEVIRKFISPNPFFTVFIKPSLLKGSRVSIPNLKIDIKDKREVILKIEKRSWNVKLLPTAGDRKLLSTGWALFFLSMATQIRLQRNAILPFHFFKIITGPNLQRLRIPSKFTKLYGGGLPNPVLLKPKDCAEWKVYWTKENEVYWFEKGWSEFVENYSLDHGHLVVFKYKGTSKIEVIILDQSATEIDYPSYEDIHIVELKDDGLDQRVRPKSPLVYGKRKRKNSANVERNSNVKMFSAHGPAQSDKRTKFSTTRKQQQNGVKTTKRTLSLNMPRTLRGQEKHVPKFLDVEMKMKEKNVTVQHEDKCWEVKVICAQSGEYDRFTCGWSVFARQSQLQAGDVCVFEIIDPKVPLLKANIFKSISM